MFFFFFFVLNIKINFLLFFLFYTNTVLIEKFGFYQIYPERTDEINIVFNETVFSYSTWNPQKYHFCTINIIDSIESNYSTTLPSNESIIIKGKYIQFLFFGRIRPERLDLWVLPFSICQNIAFSIPNYYGITFKIQSLYLNSPICVFPNFFNSTIDLSFGFNYPYLNNNLEIYTESNLKNVFPEFSCKSAFCYKNLYYPFFIRINKFSNLKNSFYMDFKFNYSQIINNFSITQTLNLNSSGKILPFNNIYFSFNLIPNFNNYLTQFKNFIYFFITIILLILFFIELYYKYYDDEVHISYDSIEYQYLYSNQNSYNFMIKYPE